MIIMCGLITGIMGICFEQETILPGNAYTARHHTTDVHLVHVLNLRTGNIFQESLYVVILVSQ